MQEDISRNVLKHKIIILCLLLLITSINNITYMADDFSISISKQTIKQRGSTILSVTGTGDFEITLDTENIVKIGTNKIENLDGTTDIGIIGMNTGTVNVTVTNESGIQKSIEIYVSNDSKEITKSNTQTSETQINEVNNEIKENDENVNTEKINESEENKIEQDENILDEDTNKENNGIEKNVIIEEINDLDENEIEQDEKNLNEDVSEGNSENHKNNLEVTFIIVFIVTGIVVISVIVLNKRKKKSKIGKHYR